MNLVRLKNNVFSFFVPKTPEQIAAAKNPELADEERVQLVLLAQNVESLVLAILEATIDLPWMRLTVSGGNVDVEGPGREVWSLSTLFGHLKLLHIDEGYGNAPYVKLSVANNELQLASGHSEQLAAYAWNRACAREVVQVD